MLGNLPIADPKVMSEQPDYYGNERPEVAIYLPPRVSRVLEIGCGSGKFRRNVPAGAEYWGIEPNPEAAAAAAAHVDRILVGTFRELVDSLPDHHFDLVICNDVIEHMDDHDWFLERIQAKMDPARSFIVGSIPNVGYVVVLFRLLVTREWRYADSGVLDRTHLRFFTRKSLKRTFAEHGFSTEALEGIGAIRIDARTAVSFVKTAGWRLLSVLFGGDARFLQFGFRVARGRGRKSPASTGPCA
jgi:SAM-dependent methyltransferase